MEAWDPNYIFFDPECERTPWPHGPIALRVLRYLGFIIGYIHVHPVSDSPDFFAHGGIKVAPLAEALSFG